MCDSRIRDLADEEVMQLVGTAVRAPRAAYDRHGSAAFSLAYRMVGDRVTARTSRRRPSSRSGAAMRYDPSRGSVRRGARHRPQRTIDALRRGKGTSRGARRSRASRRRPGGARANRVEGRRAARRPQRAKRASTRSPAEQRRTIELAYFGGQHKSDSGAARRADWHDQGTDAPGARQLRHQLADFRGGRIHDDPGPHDIQR